MEKKILVISDACLGEYNNSLIYFKNSVPSNYLNPYKKWMMTLESIGVSCVFKDGEYVPKIIKVHCSNIKPFMKNGEFCNELTAVTVSVSGGSGKTHAHLAGAAMTFKNKKSLRLRAPSASLNR